MAINSPIFITGYEHRLLVSGANPDNGLFGTVAGTPTIDTTVFNATGGGTASMKIDSTAAAHTVGAGGNGGAFASGTYFVSLFYLRVSSSVALAGTPAATIITGVNANGNFRLDLLNTGALRVFGATGSVSATSTTILATDQWYKIMVEFDARANPGIIRLWIFDTAEQVSVSTIAQASASFTAINVGNSSTAAGLRSVLNIDDYMLYNTAGDYDLLKGIGPYGIQLLDPVAVGVHGSPSNFSDHTATTLTVGDSSSWSELTDFPGASNTTSFVQQNTATGYLEYKMAAPGVGTRVLALRAIMSVFNASSTLANNISFRVVDSTGTEGADLHLVSVSSLTIVYRGAMAVRPSGGDWSMAELTAQTFRYRIGYSTDISPAPRVSAIAIEAAINIPAPVNRHMYNGSADIRQASFAL